MKSAIILMILLILTGCASNKVEDSSPISANNIEIKGFAFNPSVITIAKGTTVTWTNLDNTLHTATGENFDTGSLDKGQSKSITFNEAGTFEYKCNFHPMMKGTIIVN